MFIRGFDGVTTTPTPQQLEAGLGLAVAVGSLHRASFPSTKCVVLRYHHLFITRFSPETFTEGNISKDD